MDVVKKSTDSFFLKGNSTGCLLIHGFTGTPSEMRFLGEKIAAAGYTVSCPLMPGHGSSPEELATTSWNDWVSEIYQELDRVKQSCSRVIIIGLSMGGLIALHLAAREALSGVIAMNTPVILKNLGARLTFLYRPFVKYIDKPSSHRFVPEGKDPDDRFTYDRVPVNCLDSLNQAIRGVRKEFKQIACPTLLMQSMKDKTVEPKSVRTIQKRINKVQAEVVYWEKSGHILPLGPEREEVAKYIIEYIDRIT